MVLLSPDGAQGIDRGEGWDVLEGVEIEQTLVAGDDQIDLGGECQGEDVVIVGSRQTGCGRGSGTRTSASA